jgi:hypothetical protein
VGSGIVVDRVAGFSLLCALGSRIDLDCLRFWVLGIQVEPVHFSSLPFKDLAKSHFLGD